ncbi:MAG TPA: thiamine-phosphate kinase [Candidatus Sulfotelmatobacter sp.]|nr:thiamine-phosphate kinase [Candidatus Sulfotelmatobacter sp.]
MSTFGTEREKTVSQHKNEQRNHATAKILGERSIIEIIRKHLEGLQDLPIPFGDDVAAVSIDAERVAVLKTDMLVNKTDVPKGMNLQQAARKAIVMNVSDFAAKGVQPLAALVSLGLPEAATRDEIEEIAEGLHSGACEYQVRVVGGDTGEADNVVIAISMYGIATRSKLMLRNTAKAGDIVAVTGCFGKSAAGLRLLIEDSKISNRLREALLDSVLMPRARLKEGLALANSGAVTSSIDSSDGFAWSLYEISKMADVGFIIDELPVAIEAEQFAESCRIDVLELVLYGGEEYELIITVKPERWADAEAAIEAVGGRLFRVGKVTHEKHIILDLEGQERVIEPRGWEHFKSKP